MNDKKDKLIYTSAFWNIVTTGKCNGNSSDDAVVFIECKCEKTGENKSSKSLKLDSKKH